MNILSLFDGISCGRLALERAGIKVDRYIAYEIDETAISISKKNWPDIEHCGDVTKENFKKYAGAIDGLIGGSPCQSLSIVRSQDRLNLDGKSKLFFEFVRALNECKPKWFLFENVASMNQESKDAISYYLGVEPILIDGNAFSAQDRPRLIWTNLHIDSDIPSECNKTLRDIMQKHGDIAEKYFYNRPYIYHGDKQVCATLQVNTHDMLKRVYNPNFKCATLTCVRGGYQEKKVLDGDRVRKLTPIEYERLQGLPDGYTDGHRDSARYTAIGNGWQVDCIAWLFKNGLE